jgi:hypothetical protein
LLDVPTIDIAPLTDRILDGIFDLLPKRLIARIFSRITLPLDRTLDSIVDHLLNTLIPRISTSIRIISSTRIAVFVSIV